MPARDRGAQRAGVPICPLPPELLLADAAQGLLADTQTMEHYGFSCGLAELKPSSKQAKHKGRLQRLR